MRVFESTTTAICGVCSDFGKESMKCVIMNTTTAVSQL
jgi:hypothetical protein